MISLLTNEICSVFYEIITWKNVSNNRSDHEDYPVSKSGVNQVCFPISSCAVAKISTLFIKCFGSRKSFCLGNAKNWSVASIQTDRTLRESHGNKLKFGRWIAAGRKIKATKRLRSKRPKKFSLCWIQQLNWCPWASVNQPPLSLWA